MTYCVKVATKVKRLALLDHLTTSIYQVTSKAVCHQDLCIPRKKKMKNLCRVLNYDICNVLLFFLSPISSRCPRRVSMKVEAFEKAILVDDATWNNLHAAGVEKDGGIFRCFREWSEIWLTFCTTRSVKDCVRYGWFRFDWEHGNVFSSVWFAQEKRKPTGGWFGMVCWWKVFKQ